jgi:hypothetical protein
MATNSGICSPDILLTVHRQADQNSGNKTDQLSAEQRAEQELAAGIHDDLEHDHAHRGPKHRECEICKLEIVCACAFVLGVLHYKPEVPNSPLFLLFGFKRPSLFGT